ncbi:hypothetical protein [Arthrobacter sp. efr-133-TYG-118]|uniref:hypothetical protein n=1 Tax=Arthrobacter sp. efr-133-TYG-118 TaxID=3040279 RepID=UPI00254E96C1|nr:hypothetical protein [Arthrobacter sp. efr-133-TYG-118]
MTDYHFIGAFPRVLAGLSQGVNALILPVDRDAPPYGSTIEARPGDVIQTDAPYVHPELAEVEASDAHGLSPADEAWAQANPVPVVPVEPVAPVADPAPDAMTAEGAPAPAEPTN